MVRILIIENDEVTARELHGWIDNEGYGIDIAKTGKEGLLQLQRYSYDVVLLSGHLPDINGPDFCKKVNNSNLALPIVILNAQSDVEQAVVALDSGAQDYLITPTQLPELSARLRSILRRYSRYVKQSPIVVPFNTPAVTSVPFAQ